MASSRSGRGEPLDLPGFRNLVGAHCSSSAVRSVLLYDGIELSEAAVFGLGAGVGFFYLREPGGSPSRRFNGRAPDLEGSFYRRVGTPLRWEGAWRPEAIDEALRAGRPLLAQTDIHPIPYYDDVHFIGHGIAVVGRSGDELRVADIAAEACSRMSVAQLRDAVGVEHAPLMRPWRYGAAPRVERVDVAALAPGAVRQAAGYMLAPPTPREGLPAMRELARDLARDWPRRDDASWCARFGYQAIEKRGTGGGSFRRLYADFLAELAPDHPALAALAPGFREAAAGWSGVAELLKGAAFSEDPAELSAGLAAAGRRLAELAEREEGLFEALGAAAAEAGGAGAGGAGAA